MQAVIVGGGMGGLFTALALRQAGVFTEINVYEQTKSPSTAGAGLNIPPNGARICRWLGIDLDGGDPKGPHGAVDGGRAAILDGVRQVMLDGTVARKPINQPGAFGDGAGFHHMHRLDLLMCLYKRVFELGPDSGVECPIRVHMNKRLQSLTQTDAMVTAGFADGSTASGDVLIGADGIRSAIRNQIVGEAPVDYTGQVAWRINVPTERLPKGFMEHITEIWVGPNKHGVVYFLRRGEILNFVGCVDHAEWSEESWTQRYPHAELKADFAGWHQNIQTILDAADPNECYRWALNNRVPVRNWRTSRAVIMGDAAHPTLPYMAQGAVMAIEDGAVLTRALQACDDVTDALELFQQSRVDRTARIVTESNANKKLFHLKSEQLLREAFAARDMNAERSKWLFSYDALKVELGAPA